MVIQTVHGSQRQKLKHVTTRNLEMRAKADDQGVIGITNEDEAEAVCLNTAVVDTAIYQVIAQGEFLAYKSEPYERNCDHARVNEDSVDGSSLFHFG